MAASMERSKDPYEMGFLIAPRVPQGLAAVVESLTREVLRQRPEDIYVFAARHFEKLLTLREQYDVGKTTGSECNFYNTVKKRGECKESRKRRSTLKDIGTTSGWSLNEAAKVLERHRNIFGDGENRISTEEVRALANERNGRSTSGTKNKRDKRRSSNATQEYSKDPMRTTGENNDSTRLDRSAKTLKIISQIPTVLTRNSGTKDIKMELRKNRLREKSTDSSNEGLLPERTGDMSRKSVGKSERAESIQKFEEERISKKTVRRSGSVERSSSQSSRTRRRKGSFSELLDRNELPRAGSMDQVKEYVVRTFASTKNIDELDLGYVERVQDVIDRNVPIIKDKIDNLKNDVIFETPKRRESVAEIDNRVVDRSTAKIERPRKRESRPNTSDNDSRRSIENQESYRSKRSSSVDSTASRRQQDDTLEARLIDTQNILEDISSICYPKSQNVSHRPKSSNGQLNDQENDYSTSEGDSKIILPAVRPSSSRSSRSLSRNESDNLILPPISPDTSKIPKKKNDATLPTLSLVTIESSSSSASLRPEENENDSRDDKNDDLGKEILELSTSIKEDISSTRKMLEGVNDAFKTSMTSDDREKVDEETYSEEDVANVKEEDLIQETIEKPDDVLDRKVLEFTNVEEIFKDSLNVTPDIIDIPQRPDSLEPQVEDERPTTTDSHLSTVDEGVELKQRLIEIQEMERNVEKAIGSFEESINKDEIKDSESVLVTTKDATAKETEDSIVVKSKEFVEIEDETIRETPDTNRPKEESATNATISINRINESSDRSDNNIDNESNNLDILQCVTVDDEATKNIELGKSQMIKTETKVEDNKENPKTSGVEEADGAQDSPLSSKGKEDKNSVPISLPALPKEVPYSYILTEGSPVEIPDFVTTVIIPERPPSTPELDFDNNGDVELREERRKRAVESFGEYIRPEPIECSTVDIDFIRGIKSGHDIAIVRQDLDGIKEEEEDDEEKRSKATDQVSKTEIKKDNIPVLEHISENEEIEENDESNKSETKIILKEQDDTGAKEIVIESENLIDNRNGTNTDNANVEISLEGEESTETADVTSDSTNEVKETTITDRSTDSSSLDPARPIVPELNLDSLRDMTVSSSKMNDADVTISLTEPISSEKEKADMEENIAMKEEENLDSDQKGDTSGMETISMDEKPIRVEPLLTDFETEETNKEEVMVPTEETVENAEVELVISSERNTESVLPENVEQRDTIKSAALPSSYLELEGNAADLDTEEEIAKELIEIDRAENPPLPQETQITPDGNSQEQSYEIVNSNGTIEDRVEVSTTVEPSIGEEERKRGDDVTSPKIESSTISVENIQETVMTKNNEEIISGVVESRKSSSNEEGKDRSNGSPEDNERSDTSVTAFEQEDVKKLDLDTKLGEKKEYHVYVTDIGPTESQDDNTRSSSTTFHSAATKIQAGVRDFLRRRRLQASNCQGSTLDNVPSIKDSFADEPIATDVQSNSEIVLNPPVETAVASTVRSEKVTTAEEKENIPLAQTASVPAKSRQCLRREDAMQRNTLSTENAFASSGVQHTGEFHDCLPLPVLESSEIPRRTNLSQNEDKNEGSVQDSIDQETDTTKEESPIDSPNNLTAESKEHSGYETIENVDPTPADFVQDLNNLLGGLHPKDFAKLLTGQASTPIVVGLIDIAPNPVLGTSSNIIFDDDLMRPVKDESTLQNRYLNFITSVEDSESSHAKDTVQEYKDHSNDHSMQSLREPLALPGTPEGIVIEELSSLDSTTLSKLRDASFNPTSLESVMMDRESIDKSVMDSEKSTELPEKSNDGNLQIPTTSTDKEIEIDNKQSITSESDTSTSTKTSALTTSDESDELIESSKSPKEDVVKNEGPTVEKKGEVLSEDDQDNNKNEEIIERSTSKSLSSGSDKIESDQNAKSKDGTKSDQLSGDDKNKNENQERIQRSTDKSLSSESDKIDSDQNAETKQETKSDQLSEDGKDNNMNQETVERSTGKSLSPETKEADSDQNGECGLEAKEETESDQLSKDDKDNNKNEEIIERSTSKSLSSGSDKIGSDQNAKSKEETKSDQPSEDGKDNNTIQETVERSSNTSLSPETKEVVSDQNIEPTLEAREETKINKSSEDDKDDNKDEGAIERSTVTSLSLETKEVDSDQNIQPTLEAREQTKIDQLSEDDQNNSKNGGATERSTVTSLSFETKEADSDKIIEPDSEAK